MSANPDRPQIAAPNQIPADVAHLESITPAKRQRDARTMVAMMQRVTGLPPAMWGTMIAFGRYSYRYDSGHSGEAGAAAFAGRKNALTIYFPDGIGSHAASLERLGPHTTGVGCLYLKDLDQVDLDVLESMIATSYASVTDGTWTQRARDGRA